MLTWLSNGIPDIHSKARQTLEILHELLIVDIRWHEQIDSQLINQNIGLNRLTELWCEKIPLPHITRGQQSDPLSPLIYQPAQNALNTARRILAISKGEFVFGGQPHVMNEVRV